MIPSSEEITFVIYNNRSVDGVVMNFLQSMDMDMHRLIDLEAQFAWCDRMVSEVRTIEVAESELNLEHTDISYGPDDLAQCGDLIIKSIEALSAPPKSIPVEICKEKTWLYSRGINTGKDEFEEWFCANYDDPDYWSIANGEVWFNPTVYSEAYKVYISSTRVLHLGSLSYVIEHATTRQLDVLGITCHPMLTNILDDDLSGGGIIIPLFNGNKLVNCTIRRISDVGKLKYTQSCPDISVWNLDNINPLLPTWMTEGLFDMDAINLSGVDKQAVSVSSAMWSVPQLMQLMSKVGKFINIFADNDKVGLRTAMIMKRFLEMNGFTVGTYVSKTCKDPSEHFTEKKLGWDDVVEIEITSEMIESQDDMSFNFLKYLKNRKF